MTHVNISYYNIICSIYIIYLLSSTYLYIHIYCIALVDERVKTLITQDWDGSWNSDLNKRLRTAPWFIVYQIMSIVHRGTSRTFTNQRRIVSERDKVHGYNLTHEFKWIHKSNFATDHRYLLPISFFKLRNRPAINRSYGYLFR